MFTSLLTTKFYFPPARTNLVSRPRLIEQLNEGLQRPLTLISAPAGFGKTSLMSEWRMEAGSGTAAAWLALDEADNDSTRFWLYLIAALETLTSNSFDTIRTLLQAPQPVPPEVMISSIIHELESLTNDSFLVLDDLHTITSPVIQKALVFLLDHLPRKMHLVILTRADPPLPLARLRARNHLTELRVADLRFSAEEAAAFLSQTMGLSLSQEQVVSLDTRTEGWIAGLQLAALSMQGREDVEGFVASFAGSHHYVVDYLLEEVLNRQPEAIRDFLLKTSILERMNASLCNVLTGGSNGQVMLEKLEQTNLFVVRLDNERQWYRYHHLFADVLQIRLRQSHPERLGELHERASEWLEKNHRLPEALRHALAGTNRERAGRLAEQHDVELLARGELVALLNFLETLKELVHERPALCIDKAWALMLTGQMEEVETLLQRAEQLIADSTNNDETANHLVGNIAAIRCYLESSGGNAERSLELGEHALNILAENNPGVRGTVHLAMGNAFHRRGELDAAIQSLRQAGRLGKLAGNPQIVVMAISAVGNILLGQGKLHQAEETFREALRSAHLPNGQLLPVAARALAGLSKLSFRWNDLGTAQEYAEQSYDLGQKWGNADALVTAHVMLARVHQVRWEVENAEKSIRAAEDLVHTRRLMITNAEWVEESRAWLWLEQRNFEACDRWVHTNITQGLVNEIANEKRIILARIMLAQGKAAAALKILSQLLREHEACGEWPGVIEVLVFQSLAFQQMGDSSSALKALERALTLAEPEGYIRVFVGQGAPIKELLKKVSDKKRNKPDPSDSFTTSEAGMRNYIHKLLASFHDSSSIPAKNLETGKVHPSFELIEPLSEREREVLRLVSTGKSNQDIANELVLAVGTVKKHISNIFNKFNVDSRTACIARARQLHLID